MSDLGQILKDCQGMVPLAETNGLGRDRTKLSSITQRLESEQTSTMLERAGFRF